MGAGALRGLVPYGRSLRSQLQFSAALLHSLGIKVFSSPIQAKEVNSQALGPIHFIKTPVQV